MRDYLYIWNDPKEHFIVASGIEFRDVASLFRGDGGLILLDHEYGNAILDPASRFEYVMNPDLPAIIQEDIYSWGNLCWVDYKGRTFPQMSTQAIAELLFFNHAAEPLSGIEFDCLQNQFLCWAHDDGWYLKLYYRNWKSVESLLSVVLKGLDADIVTSKDICTGNDAYWISAGTIECCQKTHDVDGLLNKRLD